MRRFLATLLTVVLVLSGIIWVVPAKSQAATTGIEGFVTRLYNVCLDRNPDAKGLKDWSDKLNNRQSTGISVAAGFIFSKEFQSKNCTNGEYVDYMYSAFFGREADPAGYDYWVKQLENGATREHVFAGFANSKEFYELCASFGVIRGDYFEGKDFNKVASVNLFVDRLYSIVLGRSCDAAGMSDWTNKLVTGKMSGADVAAGFFFSPEYTAKNKSDSAYVEDLYLAMMGRNSDAAGKAGWVLKLKTGADKKAVFNGFVGSQEFMAICKSYGITVGNGISVPGSDSGASKFEVLCNGYKVQEINIPGYGTIYGYYVDTTAFDNNIKNHRSDLGLSTSFVDNDFVKIRAAECTVLFEHKRPGGGTVFASGFYSEIICTSADGDKAFNLFMGSSGHKGIIEKADMPVFATASFVRCEWNGTSWNVVKSATCAQSHY